MYKGTVKKKTNSAGDSLYISVYRSETLSMYTRLYKYNSIYHQLGMAIETSQFEDSKTTHTIKDTLQIGCM